MYVRARQALGASLTDPCRTPVDGKCPSHYIPGQGNVCKDWWLDQTAGDKRRGDPGVCRPPGEKIQIYDQRNVEETGGKITVFEKSESGITKTGEITSPIWADCEARGLPALECYKLRIENKIQGDEAQRIMEQTHAQEIAELKAKKMRTYFIVGGVAVAAIIGLSFLRRG